MIEWPGVRMEFGEPTIDDYQVQTGYLDLAIEADVTLTAGARVLWHESSVDIIELARQLDAWLQRGRGKAGDFREAISATPPAP